MPADSRIYDSDRLACRYARALVARAKTVMGVDPYLKMLSQARDRLPAATFIQATADALPAKAASMDLVTAAGSLN